MVAAQRAVNAQRSQPLCGRNVILADTDTNARSTLAQLAIAAGAFVREAGSLSEMALLARSLPTDVVLLDTSLQGNIPAAVRALRLMHVPVMLLKSGHDTPRKSLEALISMGIHGVVVSPCRLDVILQRISDAVAQKLPPRLATDGHREFAHTRTPTDPYSTRHVADCNSILSQGMLCPFHHGSALIKRYILRTGRIIGDVNFFDIPTFSSASYGVDFINFNEVCVSICPDCLFASINPEYFLTPADRKNRTQQFDDDVRTAINDGMAARRSLAGDIGDRLFTHRRGADGAEIALRLAIECAKTLCDVAPHRFTAELLRLANYHLRLAEHKDRQHAHPSEVANQVSKARDALCKSYSVAQGQSLYKNTYQLIAASIYFGQDGDAHQYLRQLRELERNSPPADRLAAARYLTRSNKAWDARDLHRIPDAANATGIEPAPLSTQFHAPFAA
jgi:DNA-binding NarL/FixJ family response regulator